MLQSSELIYGTSALEGRLAAMPERPLSSGWRDPYPLTDEFADKQCAIVDDWVANLYLYCRRRPPTGLRMYAMVCDAERWLNSSQPIREGIPVTIKTRNHMARWMLRIARMAPH